MGKDTKKEKFSISKAEQYEFWRSIAYCTDGTIPGNVRLAAFDKMLELCGEQKETQRKWIISMRTENG